MEIQYIKGGQIDKVKWNSCVHYANNGNIFGYMWYLDHVAKDWDALVEGDYESVFPLVWRPRLFQRKELFQPNLMREMGIYSIHVLSPARIMAFLKAIPSDFKYIDIALNEQNTPPPGSGFELQEKQNHQLLLNRPYEQLFDHFSTELAQKLQIAEDAGLVLTGGLKPETIADFFRLHTPAGQQSAQDFHGLQRIMYNALHRGWGFASGVMGLDQKLHAVNFFIYSHGKVLSLVPVESSEGSALGALAYLFNGLIRSQAGKPAVLDFNMDGSSGLPQQFGAQANPYFQLRRNDLWLGWL
jgi:hypothetical protein